MIPTRVVLAISGALIIIAGAGCTGNSSCQRGTQLDRNWGRSYETAKYNQILNPEAEKDSTPVTGLKGQVGERIMEDYVKGPPKKKSSRRGIGVLTVE
jgi:hypothetical protein